MDNNSKPNSNQTHQINLGPQTKPRKRKKKVPDKETNYSKEIKETEVDKTKKQIFGVTTMMDTLKRINVQNQSKFKYLKPGAHPKFNPRKKTKKEPRKDEMEIQEEDVNMNSRDSMLNRKREIERDEEEEYEEEEIPSEAKMNEEDKQFLNDQMEGLKFSGDVGKNWQTLMKEAEQGYANIEQQRNTQIDAQKQSVYTKTDVPIVNLMSTFKQGSGPKDNPERTFKWIIDDLNYFMSSNDPKHKDYQDPMIQIRITLNGLFAIVRDLIQEVAELRTLSIKQHIALKKIAEESVKLKIATDDRILQLEKPVDKWLKQENHEESPEAKKFREEKRKIREAAKVVRIQKYKDNKSWIEDKEWEKWTPGQKALYRFTFSDVHQNLTAEQWRTLNREGKQKFLVMKMEYRKKREKEIEDLEKSNKETANRQRKQFNFFKMRVIDRGIVTDLNGNPFRNTPYQKRY